MAILLHYSVSKLLSRWSYSGCATQNILSITEATLSCDAEKRKFKKDAVMSEYSDVLERYWRRVRAYGRESTPWIRPECCSHSYAATLCTCCIKEKLKKVLDRLTQSKVISPIQEGTDWISSMIATKKLAGNILQRLKYSAKFIWKKAFFNLNWTKNPVN